MRRQILIITLILMASNVFGSNEDTSVDDSGLTYEEKLAACGACHGINGDAPLAPDYPVLSGQYADYLQSALNDYKTGRRQHMIMNMQVDALQLSDSDIARLSAYFSSKPGVIGLGE
jgi:cytochrome c553